MPAPAGAIESQSGWNNGATQSTKMRYVVEVVEVVEEPWTDLSVVKYSRIVRRTEL